AAGAPDSPGAPERAAPALAPAAAPPLPVAVAHRALLDEIERTLAAARGVSAAARRGLGARLDQLAAVLDPLDAAAAEVVLDELEDLLQALLSAAGWPASGEESPQDG
ncbi:MAG TPA: hypothetical protein VN253_14735, partial [Kofleriaceae bacterium]|nr:hypothetical protein [Kofleriaceae bacterium]